MESVTKGQAIKINGSDFTVIVAGANLIQLAGKRGAVHVIVRNVHSGRWIFLRNGMREERITSIEAAA